jgi:DNA polymerase I-like protein with 3'-5' exonuclease and polymerase domains
MKIGTFDLETDGLYEDCTRVWCGVVKEHGDVEGCARRSFGPDSIPNLLVHLDTFDVLIGHNCIDFDFRVLRKLYGWEFEGKKVDTLIMSRTQRPERSLPKGWTGPRVGPHSVAAWGSRLGNAKLEHNEWDKYSPEMLHRCEQDVDIQVEIYHALMEEGKGEGWGPAHRLNMRLFDLLRRQEEFGWYVDQPHMQRCLDMLEHWMARIDKAVAPRLPLVVEVDHTKVKGEWGYVKKPFKKDGSYAAITERFVDGFDGGQLFNLGMVGGPFSRVRFRPVNLDKNVEVKRFLLDLGWIPDEWNTNNTGARTSPKLSHDDSFKGIQGGLGQLIARRVQCKQRRGTISGWRESIRHDGRIGAAVAGVATTGRLRHKTIVNVPSPHSKAFFANWMRAIFSVPPERVLVGVDSKGNQVRQLAARMGDPEFTHAVLHGNSDDGTDFHSVNQRRTGAPSRSRAKNFYYGLVFGAGDAKIGEVIDGTAADGKRLKAEYFEEFPGLKELIERETAYWRSTAQKWYNKKWGRFEYRNGYIRGIDGRPILVDSEHKILCYLLQSDEAIQMGHAYVDTYDRLTARGYEFGKDWGFVIWMHDEYQIECDPAIAETVAEEGCAAIKWAGEHLNIQCPHDGDAIIGHNWKETH